MAGCTIVVHNTGGYVAVQQLLYFRRCVGNMTFIINELAATVGNVALLQRK